MIAQRPPGAAPGRAGERRGAAVRRRELRRGDGGPHAAPLERLARGCAELRRVARDAWSSSRGTRRCVGADVAGPRVLPRALREDAARLRRARPIRPRRWAPRSRSCRSRATAATGSSAPSGAGPRPTSTRRCAAGISTLPAQRGRARRRARAPARRPRQRRLGAPPRRPARARRARPRLPPARRPERAVGARERRVLGSAAICPCPRESPCRSRSRPLVVALQRVAQPSRVKPPRPRRAPPRARPPRTERGARSRRPSAPPRARPAAKRAAAQAKAPPSKAERRRRARSSRAARHAAQGRRRDAGGVKEAMDDAVKRGRITRKDADRR